MTTRKSKIAALRRQGWTILEGAYRDTTDDRLKGWYATGPGMLAMSKIGSGYASKSEAWDAVIRHTESLEEI
jgi:hypothetical protein